MLIRVAKITFIILTNQKRGAASFKTALTNLINRNMAERQFIGSLSEEQKIRLIEFREDFIPFYKEVHGHEPSESTIIIAEYAFKCGWYDCNHVIKLKLNELES